MTPPWRVMRLDDPADALDVGVAVLLGEPEALGEVRAHDVAVERLDHAAASLELRNHEVGDRGLARARQAREPDRESLRLAHIQNSLSRKEGKVIQPTSGRPLTPRRPACRPSGPTARLDLKTWRAADTTLRTLLWECQPLSADPGRSASRMSERLPMSRSRSRGRSTSSSGRSSTAPASARSPSSPCTCCATSSRATERSDGRTGRAAFTRGARRGAPAPPGARLPGASIRRAARARGRCRRSGRGRDAARSGSPRCGSRPRACDRCSRGGTSPSAR